MSALFEMVRRLPVTLSLLGLAGAVSGYRLMFGIDQSGTAGGSGAWEAWYGPGIWFGCATIVLLAGRFRWGLLGAGLWLGASVGAWYSAMRVYLAAADDQAAAGMMLAGFVGAALLSLAEAAFLKGTTLGRLVLTALMGGGLGGVMWLVLQLIPDGHPGMRFALAFAIWQIGVGLVISYRRSGSGRLSR